MWTIRYAVSVAVITACLLAVGTVLWTRDNAVLKSEALGAGEYWRGDVNAPVSVDVYMDFG